ncbi:MAG: HAMP domain-containing protein [Kineosporiaceae bacterium]|nr:HAMP domain-containing protein [Kineosporiaceae bacterium]
MPRTLRAQLVAVLVLLTAAITLLVGASSLIALERQLTAQLEQQLTAAITRSTPGIGSPDDSRHPDQDDDGPSFLGLRGQAEGTLGAQITDQGVVESGVIGSLSRTLPLTGAQQQLLLALPADGRSHEVHLGGDLGEYLVRAVEDPRGGRAVIGLPTTGIARTLAHQAGNVVWVALIAVLLAVVAGSVLIRLALRPLRRVAATARRVAELPLERGDVTLHERLPDRDADPRTEVGQVGGAINRMLDHIDAALAVRTASEARMRRFVADASHELRTPLASVRGYAELTRRQNGDVPEPIRQAMSRVEAESLRMTGLVEDLLLLARLDESPQAAALRHEEVDLSAALIDCVNDARLLGPDHHWSLDLPPEPVATLGDDARLRQVLTNLLTNARVHTPAGTRVRAALRRRSGQVVVEVSDDGPGIAPQLQPAVFDRFARGDTSRSRAAGSTGLGLAIVASVAQAHGGRVELDSEPGRTMIRVVLPEAR